MRKFIRHHSDFEQTRDRLQSGINYKFAKRKPNRNFITCQEKPKMKNIFLFLSLLFGLICQSLILSAQYVKLHDFDSINGANPRGRLIVAGGKLYGVTERGGDFNCGVIFSMHFDGTDYK